VRPGRTRSAARSAARLVYEDELILAYDKPVGLPVIAPDGSRSRCLLDVASEQVRRRNPKGRAAVVHRIDRDTSGIVVFARDARAKRLLMSGWDEIVSERLYVALVEGEMGSSEGELDSFLVEDARGFVREAGPRERGAKRALSRWRVIAEGRGMSLLEVRLETGRKHQIRVQLAGIGHPVVGDERYGGRARYGREARGEAPREGERSASRPRPVSSPTLARLCLHAAAIELRLPESSGSVRIESSAPPEFAEALGKRSASSESAGRDRPPARGGGSDITERAPRELRPGRFNGPRDGGPASRRGGPRRGRR